MVKGTSHQKEKATGLARTTVINQREEESHSDINESNQVFDHVISMANLDKEQMINLEDLKLQDDEERRQDESSDPSDRAEQKGLLNDSSSYQSVEDDDDEMAAESPRHILCCDNNSEMLMSDCI